MENKTLVTYTTMSGSTKEVAQAVATELEKCGAVVDVLHMREVGEISHYGAAVVGGPMVMGWHRQAVKFLKQHQPALRQIPVAYFFTAMSLTQTNTTGLGAVPVAIDPNLPQIPKKPGRLGLKERYATVEHYLGPVLRAVPHIQPVSVGFFGGKLDYARLKPLQMLFVMLIIQARPGDRRNWPAIRGWAANLSDMLQV
jgi:menaquinone-dependent protoporphyrinogen IX oxidase